MPSSTEPTYSWGNTAEIGIAANSFSEISKVIGVAFLIILVIALACVMVFVVMGCRSVQRRRSIQQDKHRRRRSSTARKKCKRKPHPRPHSKLKQNSLERADVPRIPDHARNVQRQTRNVKKRTTNIQHYAKGTHNDTSNTADHTQNIKTMQQRISRTWNRKYGRRRRSRSNRSLVETISSVSTGKVAVPDENVFISSKL